MEERDKHRFAKLILGALQAYPSITCSEGVVTAYWWLLRDFDFAVIARATKRAVLASPIYPPTASQIHQFACAERRRLTGINVVRKSLPLPSGGVESWVPKSAAARRLTDLAAEWQETPPASRADSIKAIKKITGCLNET
jgi:hypothetical protein